ncbi:hypothetical protein [Streptomyces sp. NPDC102476]|uniref:hypothetical protein n=1 Tax=Streptomyces sp. NPDC102476 TaxID=3366181 RepID=UPI00382E9FCF
MEIVQRTPGQQFNVLFACRCLSHRPQRNRVKSCGGQESVDRDGVGGTAAKTSISRGHQ